MLAEKKVRRAVTRKRSVIDDLVVTIDVGNTNTDVALIDANAFKVLSCKTIKSSFVTSKIPGAISQMLKSAKFTAKPVINGSSVIRTIMTDIDQALSRRGFGAVNWLSSDAKMPIRIAYKTPKTLGLDRIANALYGHAKGRGANCILIDSGTAITIDFLKAGRTYIGGVIMPGVSMQLKALNQNTAELPCVEALREDYTFPGISTKSCILAGVLDGVAGGINHTVKKLQAESAGPWKIYATGGAWPLTEHLINFRYQHVADMTILGLSLFRR